MGWWAEHVVPRLVDVSLGNATIGRLRAQVCTPLTGRVLEIGFGGGLNLPYLPSAVTALDAVEPSEVAWRRSTRLRRGSHVAVRRVGLDGQKIDAPSGSYDSVLCTFSLCTIPDPALALAEVVRLVRPGGSVAFLEHGLSPHPKVSRLQHRLDPLQQRIAGGCHLTRDPVELLRAAGLRPTGVEHEYLAGGPGRAFTYLTYGRAIAG